MPKKWINLILSSVVFIVWMIIFYRFIFGEGETVDVNTDIPVTNKRNVLFRETLYDSLPKSNPFNNPYNFRKPVPAPNITERIPRPAYFPQTRLLGILTDEHGKLAIIEFENGQTRFMRQGDMFMEIKILLIAEHEIEVIFGKERKVIGF
jgi:hypothetical protein